MLLNKDCSLLQDSSSHSTTINASHQNSVLANTNNNKTRINNKDESQIMTTTATSKNLVDLNYLNDYTSLYFEVGDLCLPFSNANTYNTPDYFLNLNQNNSSTCGANYQRCSSVPVNLSFFSSEEDEDFNAALGLNTINATSTDNPSLLVNNDQKINDNNNDQISSLENEISSSIQNEIDSKNVILSNKKSPTKRKTKDGENTQNNELQIDFKSIIQNEHCMVYTCLRRACGVDVTSKEEIISHLSVMHNIQLSIDADESELNQYVRWTHKCIYKAAGEPIECGKKLESLAKIAHHIRKEHTDLLVNHFPNHKNLNYFYMCSHEDCLWLFENESSLKLHKLKHKMSSNAILPLEERKKHACNQCNMKFLRPSHLRAHIKLHEQNQIPKIQCSQCKETFLNRDDLQIHLDQLHKEPEKLFKCSYQNCSRAYSCQTYLSAHITKMHKNENTGAKAESHPGKTCNICKKQFRAGYLKREHEECVHQGRLVKCTYENCNKAFATRNNLKRHLKIHEKDEANFQFKCDYQNCTAMFSRHDHLTNHKVSHEPEKMFACDFPGCKSVFRYNNNLVSHKKVTHAIMTETNATCRIGLSKNQPNTATRQYLVLNMGNNNNVSPALSLKPKRVAKRSTSSSSSSVSENSSSSTEFPNRKRIRLSIVQPVSNNSQMLTSASEVNHKMLVCSYCSFGFESSESLNQHLKSHLDVNKVSEKLNDYLLTIEPSDDLNSSGKDLISDSQPLQHQVEKSGAETNSSYFLYNVHSQACEDNNINEQEGDSNKFLTSFGFTEDTSDFSKSNNRHEHVINMNSDDEEFTTCSVVLDNLSGSARTDYKFNHMYIEKYALKKKQKNQQMGSNKKMKLLDISEENFASSKSTSPSSDVSPLESPNYSIPSSLTLSPTFLN